MLFLFQYTQNIREIIRITIVEHFCILFLFRRYHLQIVLYMKLSVLKSTFSYIHCLCLLKFSLPLPSDSWSPTPPLVLAVSFPLLGRIRNFHPLATCAARRTKKTAKWILASISLFFAVSCFLLFPLVCLYYVVLRNLIFIVGNCEQMALDQYRAYRVVNDCYQNHGYHCIDKSSCCTHFC